VNRHDVPGPATGRSAGAGWCYGAPGIARALQLAAHALDEPRWERAGIAAVRSALGRPAEQRGIADAGLCHGSAGLLRLTTLLVRDADELTARPLATALPTLTADLLARADPAHPYLWAAPGPLHRPGFLDGAAGAGLALLGSTPDAGLPLDVGLPWDAALLVD
jgi:hypothetical protein